MTDTKAYFPPLQFAEYMGPVCTVFAWLPVRGWTGWHWLKTVRRRKAVVYGHLHQGGGTSQTFWMYE